MVSEWSVVRIEDIQASVKGAIAIGPFGSRLKSENYVEEGIPVIRGTNITGGPTFEGNFVYITEEKADTLGSSNVYKDDLVFPHRGSIGEVGIIQDDKRYVLSSSLMKLTCDRTKVNPKFLYYFFKTHVGKHELLKNASQVGTPGIGQPLSSLKAIEYKNPPLEVQDKIEAVITSLDDKIQLNRQTNQTLEAMAQALFKSWFVDFDPVIDNALAAGHEIPEPLQARAEQRKAFLSADASDDRLPESIRQLFPNRFVLDAEMGWIPEGWGCISLDNHIKFANGKAKKDCGSGQYPLYGANGIIGKSDDPKFNNAIIIGRVGAYCGAIEYCKNAFWSSDNTIVASPKISEKLIPFILYLLKYLDLNQYAGGAAQPLLNQATLNRIKFPFAEIEVLMQFCDAINTFLDKLTDNYHQNTTLEILRDTLLPKLISGELRLPENTNIEALQAIVAA
ncbi:restriction endonuclease subunit S [Endozoicomonas ascidiicola]|uniref:restriction endonuclease subunit S n=1 Tax=Endozoicomonas ascidiicola TaxID=1698521 RepID=UPI00082B8282|nr:restriction endonuclease subunit S [Endozoicomonas ascidiicola]